MAGYREVLAVEWDDNAVNTFRLNFDVPVYHGDIGKLTVKECLSLASLEKGSLDVLDGSPPCQGFSTAGRRNVEDPRSGLYRQYIRLLKGLKPKVFVMENVSGMVKGVMKLMFVQILKELKAAGYRVKVRRLNAKYYGVPQSRERMIFIGVRKDLGIEPSHPKGQTKPIPVCDAIGDLGNTMDASIDHIWTDESPEGKNHKNWYKAVRARQGELIRGQQKRGIWNKPASTLVTSGPMGPLVGNVGAHPLFTRTYSLLEYKRLASFPDGFKFSGDWGLGFDRIGNSVPPKMMQAIAEHIKNNILR